MRSANKMLGHMAFYPVHPPTILKYGAIDARGTGWTRPSKIPSNGPFMLKDWIVGDCITVIKNPQYHKAAQVKLEEIRFYPMENMHTEERAFRAGQLHITETFPGDKLEAGWGPHCEGPGLLADEVDEPAGKKGKTNCK